MGHLTLRERYLIEQYLNDGLTPYEISKRLNRPNPTIYREIKRGSVELLNSDLTTTVRYLADAGERVKNERGHNKGRNLAIGNNIKLADRIEYLIINNRYSPYSALETCRNEGIPVNICLSTLYNYIYSKVFYNLRPKHLIYKRKKKNHRTKTTGIALNNKKGCSIENRPKYINKRLDFGHWEMDSIEGCKNGSKETLVTMVERLSRDTLVFKTTGKTTQNTVQILDSLEKTYKGNFPYMFKSITCDNGCEFLDYKSMEKSCLNENAVRTKIYYCHPYCSSERGTNENTNRIVRRFCPKGSDFSRFSEDYIKGVQDYINTIPRKLLGGRCSKDVATEYGFV